VSRENGENFNVPFSCGNLCASSRFPGMEGGGGSVTIFTNGKVYCVFKKYRSFYYKKINFIFNRYNSFPSKHVPLDSTHVVQCSIYLSKHVLESSVLYDVRTVVAFLFVSFVVSNRKPFSGVSSHGNNQKSRIAMSDTSSTNVWVRYHGVTSSFFNLTGLVFYVDWYLEGVEELLCSSPS